MTAYMIKPRLLRIQMNCALYVKFGLKQIQNRLYIKNLKRLNQVMEDILTQATRTLRF